MRKVDKSRENRTAGKMSRENGEENMAEGERKEREKDEDERDGDTVSRMLHKNIPFKTDR